MLVVMLFALSMIAMTIWFWYKELAYGLARSRAIFDVYGRTALIFHPFMLISSFGPLLADLVITGSAIQFFKFGEGMMSATTGIAMSNVLSIFILKWDKVMEAARNQAPREAEKLKERRA